MHSATGRVDAADDRPTQQHSREVAIAREHARARDVRLGTGFAAGAAILFGTSYVATSFALRSFTPVSVAAWRGVGATILIAIVLALRWPRTMQTIRALDRRDILRLLTLGTLTGPIFIVGMNVAVAATGATIAAFVAGLYAVISAVLAPFVLHERLGRRALAGFAVALVGTALLAELDVASGSFGGIVAGFVVAVVYAFYLLLSRRWSAGGRLGGDIISFAIFFLVGATLIPLELVADPGALVPASPTPEAVIALVWLVVAPSALANLMIQASVRRVAARRTSAFLLLNPIAAATIAAVLLGERLSPTQVVGAAMVLAGIASASGLSLLGRGGGASEAEGTAGATRAGGVPGR